MPKPDQPQPPKINNFTCVPVCSFQRRHIRIDTDVLYNLLCAAKQVPQRCLAQTKKGVVKMRNCKQKEFRENATFNWCWFFDIEKIDSQVNFKKDFAFQLMSDGVSVSVLYERPVGPTAALDDDEIRKMWLAGEFSYELGIDPGMRTWNATVRRDLRNGEEVIFEKQLLFSFVHCFSVSIFRLT